MSAMPEPQSRPGAVDPSAPATALAGAEAPADEVPEREVGLQEVLQMAQQLQRQLKFDEAESIYLQILSQLHEEPNALNFFGVLRHQQGRNRDALNYISQAIAQMPEQPGPWLNLANVLIEVGEYDEATDALKRVISLAPDWGRAYNNLGVLHLRCGRFDAAEAAFKQALAIDPDIGYVHNNLASLYLRCDRPKDCVRHGMRAIVLDKHNGRARKLLSRALEMEGKHDEAVRNLQEWHAEDPTDPEAAHYLAAIGAAALPDRASDDYVKRVFDRFADSFEVQLEKLGYRAPQLICDALAGQLGRLPDRPAVLDAGCGTGLCGPLLRPLAGRLEGVDLSGGMLQRAAQRQLYDALQQAELTAFLAQRDAAYDAIVSADVLVYFGDLADVLCAAAGALRPGGVLVFSVEAAADEVQRFALAIHGRYNHAAAYVRELLAQCGLQTLAVDAQVLRLELLQPVNGWIVTAVKPTIEPAIEPAA